MSAACSEVVGIVEGDTHSFRFAGFAYPVLWLLWFMVVEGYDEGGPGQGQGFVSLRD